MDSQNTRLLKGIDTVIVRVSDIDTSKTWYRDKLGLTPIWDDPEMKLVVLDTDGPTSLTLWETDKKVNVNMDTATYPIFKTQDATSVRKELDSRGIKVGDIIQDDFVKYFFFFDPDGNVLEACQVLE